ncbi:MAG: hypothetical protein Fur0037_20730 [Planctomycetota bacterium]
MSGKLSVTALAVLAMICPARGQQPLFQAARHFTSPHPLARDVAVADLDLDGRMDIAVARNGISFGPVNCAFFTSLLDDDGTPGEGRPSGPPAGGFSLNGSTRVAAADFDGDGLVDVASLSDAGALSVFRNAMHGPYRDGFGQPLLVEDLSSRYGYVFPVRMYPSVFLAEDFDADGNADILVAGNVVDAFNGTQGSTGINVYFGHGDMTFDAVRTTAQQTAAAPLDARWIDWDGDGTAETLLLLGEICPGYGFSAPVVERYSFQGRSLTPVGAPQSFGLPSSSSASVTHPTAIDFVLSASSRRYVLCGYSMRQAASTPEVWVGHVGPAGDLPAPGFVPCALPSAVAMAADSELQAVRVADFDGDGALDAACLHLQGYVQVGPQRPAQVLVLRGPLVPAAPVPAHAIALNGSVGTLLNTTSMLGTVQAWFPNLTAPASLMIGSVTQSPEPDLFAAGLRTQSASNPSIWDSDLVVLRNARADSGGGVASVSDCRSYANGIRMRCGIAGGRPAPGNADFAITLTRAPANAIVALHAGTLYTPFVLPLAPGIGLPFGSVFSVHGNLAAMAAPARGQGISVHAAPIPARQDMSGVTIYLAWSVLDLTSNDPVPVYDSDTMRLRIW